MRKEDKGTIIAQIAETVKEYSCFYLAETATLNAEKTSNLRRACFKEGIKMMVVKNALLHKALEGLDTDYSPLYGSLKGSTTMFFANVGNAPAKLIKEFRKTSEDLVLKAAYVEEGFISEPISLMHLLLSRAKTNLLLRLSPSYNLLQRMLYRLFSQVVLPYMEYCRLYQKDKIYTKNIITNNNI